MPPPQPTYPQGGYPQDPYPPQDDYPPDGNYPPPQRGNYPPPQQGNYPPPQQDSYPPPRGYPPQGNYPPPANVPGDPYGGVQSRPMPPPGGPAVTDPALAPAPPPPPAPAARLPRGPQPGDTSPSSGDEVITEPSAQRVANSAALFTGLDKITGRILNFDVAIGETVQFGALQLTPRACYTRPPTETANTDAFVEVDEVTLQGEVRRIFTGWVFAASPGLHAVEHPIYDLWLTDCKGPLVTAERPPAEATPAAPPPARREQRQQQQPQQQPQQKQPRPQAQQQRQPTTLPPIR